jgi:hypothetical protein
VIVTNVIVTLLSTLNKFFLLLLNTCPNSATSAFRFVGGTILSLPILNVTELRADHLS